jgi:hypothetical protein
MTRINSIGGHAVLLSLNLFSGRNERSPSWRDYASSLPVDLCGPNFGREGFGSPGSPLIHLPKEPLDRWRDRLANRDCLADAFGGVGLHPSRMEKDNGIFFTFETEEFHRE